MLLDTSTVLLKSIERSRKETDVKIRSLSGLLETLNTVEEVLGRALDRFQVSNEQKSSPLTKDVIEQSSLGIHFTYFKDLPITVSCDLLRRKKAESESELMALQKKQKRLERCQSTILLEKNHNYQVGKEPSTLPKIEEGRLCTPKIRLGKVRRDEKGLFKLTEEYTYMGEEQIKSAWGKSSSLNSSEMLEGRKKEVKKKVQCSPIKASPEESPVEVTAQQTQEVSDPKDKDGEHLYSNLIDFEVMEKLDGMDPKTRGDYTAQFYRELFEGNDWLLSAKKKVNGQKALDSVENKDLSFEQPAVFSRDAARAQSVGRGRPSSDLARLFTGKKKGRPETKRERKLQTQKATQVQQCPKDRLISKNKSKRVSQWTRGNQRESDILQEDVLFCSSKAEPKAELLDRRKQKIAGMNKEFQDKP